MSPHENNLRGLCEVLIVREVMYMPSGAINDIWLHLGYSFVRVGLLI